MKEYYELSNRQKSRRLGSLVGEDFNEIYLVANRANEDEVQIIERKENFICKDLQPTPTKSTDKTLPDSSSTNRISNKQHKIHSSPNFQKTHCAMCNLSEKAGRKLIFSKKASLKQENGSTGTNYEHKNRKRHRVVLDEPSESSQENQNMPSTSAEPNLLEADTSFLIQPSHNSKPNRHSIFEPDQTSAINSMESLLKQSLERQQVFEKRVLSELREIKQSMRENKDLLSQILDKKPVSPVDEDVKLCKEHEFSSSTSDAPKIKKENETKPASPLDKHVELCENRSFPLSTIDDLKAFDKGLMNEAYCLEMIYYFGHLGGNNAKVCVRRILVKMVDNTLALNYNWLGMGKDSKLSFKSLANICKVIYGATRLDSNFKDTSSYLIEHVIERWLQNAGCRNGGC